MKRSIPLLAIAALFCAATIRSASAQDFVPPPGIKKYLIYPHGGNYFVDLFPTNFVDLDPTSVLLAYNGSDYTFPEHTGIDTEITNFTAQEIGVPIFAALSGTVIETHDGEFDMNTELNSLPSNYVKIDHGNGQTTTYFHMKKDSVAVIVGQYVEIGQQIGLTGSSGNSTQPNLHFQSEVSGEVFEPFAGSARPGPSAWVSQPPFRTDLYLRTFVLTDQDLSTWAGWPFDTTRTGTFFTGVQPVNLWFQVGNGDSMTDITLNYRHPDGSLALSIPVNVGTPRRNKWVGLSVNVNLDVVGTWQVEILTNGQLLAEAPFLVLSPGSAVENNPPGSVEAAFDPAVVASTDAPFCRITSPTVFLDADYDLVRYHYLWKVNGAIVRDVISAGLADAISPDKIRIGDELTCTITPSDGTANGPSTTVSTIVVGGQLLNISTRLAVETGDNVLIGGFIITGTEPKTVIVRAIGPALGNFGIPDPLADPTLELNGNGLVVTNDNWKDTQETEIAATGLAPSEDLESAIIATLDPGAYTAIVRGAGGGTGVGLVETYDLDSAAGTLANISTRGFVDTGDNVLIGGFIVGSDSGREGSVLVRAIGPSLSAFGVPGALQNPILELHDGSGATLATNDDWKETQQADIEANGLAPGNDRESAILATLPPGGYTAIVRGALDTTGVGLVEVYHLQ